MRIYSRKLWNRLQLDLVVFGRYFLLITTLDPALNIRKRSRQDPFTVTWETMGPYRTPVVSMLDFPGVLY